MFANFQLFPATIIFAFLSYTIQQENDPAYMQSLLAIKEACAQQYGFTVDYVNGLMASKSPLPNDDKLKCYYSCTNLKLGVIDESGNISEDQLKNISAEVWDTAIETEILKNCDVPNQGDLCATAFSMMQCVHNDSLQ